MVVYPYLEEYLNDALSGFRRERVEVKRLICKILMCTQRHFTEDGAVVISTNFLKQIGSTPTTFDKVNSTYGFFDKGDFQIGTARPMYPRPIVNEILAGFPVYNHRAQLRWVRDDLKDLEIKKVPTLIDLGEVSIPFGVKVDVDALFHYHSQLKDYGYLNEVVKFMGMVNNNIYDYGIIPQAYKVSPSGRIVGTGISIQRSRKDLRTALMNGRWDYDFKNCHPTILSHTEVSSPILDEYVCNTQEFRELITEEIGLDHNDEKDVDKIKQCLIALVFGAGRGSRNNEDTPAIERILESSDKASQFWDLNIVRGLKKDVRNCGKELLGVKEVDRDFYKTLSLKLQHIESRMLIIATRMAQPEVLIYDGWMGADVNHKAIEKCIKKDLGYAVEIKKEEVIYVK